MKPLILALSVVGLALGASDPASARKKIPPAQVEAWAACAVDKNADELKWMYILQSGQSGLKGAAFDGAVAYALAGMTRDCVPEGTGFDNDLITAFSQKAFSLWGGDVAKTSVRRGVDAWADCLAQHHSQKARAYLYATDTSFGGPRIIVEGVDPVEAIFAPTTECDAAKPSAEAINKTDLYARLNYLMRVKPRFQPSAAVEKPPPGPTAVGQAGLTLEQRNSETDRLMLSRFGDCVVRAYPKQVERAVLGWAVNPKAVNVLYEIDTTECLPALGDDAQSLRIQPSAMRYILADALARSKIAALDVSAVSRAAPLVHPVVNEAVYAPAPGQVFDEAQQKAKAGLRASFANNIALSRLGECAVRRDPKSAIALLKSEAGSAGENQAFGAMMPVLESCAANSPARHDAVAVRGEIGAALLRLTAPGSSQKRSEAN